MPQRTPPTDALAALFESEMLAVIAGEGDRVTEANDAFLHLVGATREELEAGTLNWPELTPPEHADADARAVEQLHERGWCTPYEKEFVRRDGTRVPVVMGAATLSLEPFHWISFVLDAAERRQARDRLEARARQAAALAALGEAALVERDLDAILRRTCAVLGEQLGADLANVLELAPDGGRFVLRAGWNWPEAWVGTRTVPSGRRSLAGYVVDTGAPAVVDDLHAERRFDPPPLMLAAGIESSLTVPIGPEEQLFGVLSAHSQRQRAFSPDDTSFAQGVANVLAAAVRRARDDEALREGEASLQLVLAGTSTAAWWWEVGEDRIRWSQGVAALHGLPDDGAPIAYDQLMALIHPEDRASLDDAVRRSVAEGVGYELEFRIVRPDGALRWLETEAHAERDGDGRTVRLMGIVRDVTDRRLAAQRERLLADASALLGRSLELRRALHELTELCVPAVADWCGVHLVSDEGALELAAVTAGDDPVQPPAVSLAGLDASGAEGEGEPAGEAASSIVVALRGREGVLGALSLALTESGGRRYDAAGLAFARELARRTTAAAENARLHEAERRARRLAENEADRRARLQDLAAALATATTREEVGGAFAREAAAALGADAAFLVVRDGAELVTVTSEGLPEEIVARYGARFPETTSAGTGEAFALLEPIFARSRADLAARYPGLAAEVSDAGLEAVAILPLPAGGRSVGLGGVAFHAPREFVDADRTLLVAIGRQTAQALERARFLAEAQAAQLTAEARRTALERLLTLTPRFRADTVSGTAEAICRSAMDLLGADAASVRALEEDRLRTLASVPDGETEPLAAAAAALPEVRAVVERGRPAFARDEEGAALHLPLVRGEAATAFVTAWWTAARETPDEAELALGARFADQAAIALERAERLEAQRRAEALATALERLLDPPGIEDQATVVATAREVCSVARETFRCDTAGLWERTDDGFLLLARLPPMEALPPGFELPLSVLPDEGRHMLVTRPWFEPDMPARFASHAHLFEDSGNRSVLLVPFLRNRETVLNLTLGWSAEVPEPDPATFALAQRLADRAYVALERARHTEALEDAGRLHARLEASLMPVVSAATPEAEVVLRYQAGEQRLAIGGDFADALALADGRIATIVGDVSGHGPDAAAMGATLRAGWRALVLSGTPLDGLPQGLQALLDAERPTPETFVTVALGELAADGRAIDVCSAGHPPPLVLDAEGVRELEPEVFAAPLGVLPRAEGGRSQVALRPEACVLLYSDGLIEGRSRDDPSTRFGVASLRAFLEGHVAVAPLAPGFVLDAALAHATAAHGDELPDDVAMLLIAPRPPRDASVRLPATANRLAAVREIIERVGVAAGIAQPVIDDARVAATEACANVVSHAYEPSAADEGRSMQLDVGVVGDGLVVAVSDGGVGIGGRTGTSGAGLGLPLMRHLATGVDLETGPDGTRVVLRFGPRAAGEPHAASA